MTDDLAQQWQIVQARRVGYRVGFLMGSGMMMAMLAAMYTVIPFAMFVGGVIIMVLGLLSAVVE